MSAQQSVVSKLDPQRASDIKKSATRANIKAWDVENVVDFLRALELGHLKPKFEENGIDGDFLLSMSADELKEELGITGLQAKKIFRGIKD